MIFSLRSKIIINNNKLGGSSKALGELKKKGHKVGRLRLITIPKTQTI